MLGLLVRLMLQDAWLTEIMPFVKLTNSLVLLLLNYSNASVSLPQAWADRDVDFLVVTLAITTGLCLTAFGSGYGLSRLFKLDPAERISLIYGIGMNNNGTGLVLAALVLASYPRVMVPIIFYNLVQHLLAGTVHEVTGRGGDRVSRSYVCREYRAEFYSSTPMSIGPTETHLARGEMLTGTVKVLVLVMSLLQVR